MVVLDGDAARLVGLNGVGAQAWDLIDGSRTIDDIAAAIAAKYHAPVERVSADVTAFFKELEGARLVEVRERDPDSAE